jgi:hypothetical protein
MAGTNQPQPRASDFSAGSVTDPNQSEVTRQGLFDSLLYAEAGQLSLNFFSQAIGGGITTEPGATVGTTKTAFDTNMQISNTLPSGKAWQVQGVEVYFWPGTSAAANTFVLAAPSVFAAANAAAVAGQVSDTFTFYNAGRLQFGILDKFYIDESPIGLFPVQTATAGDFGLATTSATAGEIAVVMARQIGRPYEMGAPFTLVATQNFAVNLLWAGLVAMPSGFNGRVKLRLDGYVLRSTQ